MIYQVVDTRRRNTLQNKEEDHDTDNTVPPSAGL